MIDFTIKTLESTNHQFSVEDGTTVAQLKEKIREEMGIEIGMQRLIFSGRVLSDDGRLADFDVDGKVIHLVPRPPPSPQSRASAHNPRQEMRDAIEEAQRVIDRMTTHPGPTRLAPTRHSWPLDPPSELVVDQQQMQTMTPVANRLDFIRRTLNDVRTSMQELDQLQNTDEPMDFELSSSDSEQPSTAQRARTPPNASAASPTSIEQEAYWASLGELEGDMGESSRDDPIAEHRRRPLLPAQPFLALPRDLAGLMEDLEQLRERFAPHRANYLAILRDTDVQRLSSEEVTRRRTLLELCSNVMHSFAHAYHAASDIEVNLGEVTRLSAGYSASRHQLPVQAHINVFHSQRRPEDQATAGQAANRNASPSFARLRAQRINTGPQPGAPQSGAPQTGAPQPGAPQPGAPQPGASQPGASRPRATPGDAPAQLASGTNPANPESITYQVEIETRMPIAVPLNSEFIDHLVAVAEDLHAETGLWPENFTNPLPRQPSGQNQPQAPLYGLDESAPQTGRPRAITEIENLLRLVHNAPPGAELVMSMEEIHPFEPSSIPDFETVFGSRGAGTEPAGNGPTGSNVTGPNVTGSNVTGPNVAGPNVAGPNVTGPTSSFPYYPGLNVGSIPAGSGPTGIPAGSGPAGIPAGLNVSGMPPGLGISPDGSPYTGFHMGPISISQQPDGGVIITPMGGNEGRVTTAMLNNMFNTLYRTPAANNDPNTANAAQTNVTGANGTATTASSTTAASTAASTAAPAASAGQAAPAAGAAAASATAATPSSPATSATSAPGGRTLEPAWVGGIVPELPHIVYIEQPGRRAVDPRRAADPRRRDPGAAPERARTNNQNIRAHQMAMSGMVYDSFLSCDSRFARRHVADRRAAYHALHTEQVRRRTSRRVAPSIYRLEDRNSNFTIRHMAIMMRLLSGPVSAAARVNAFMVVVARVLYLEPHGRPCFHDPHCMPREFVSVRNLLRDYMQRIIAAVMTGGGSRNMFDRVTNILIGQHQEFLERMNDYTPIDPESNPIDALRSWVRARIPAIIACVISTSPSDVFVSRFYAVFVRFYTDLCALVMNFCQHGFGGLRTLYTAFFFELTQNYEESACEWIRLVARENLAAIQNTIDPLLSNQFGRQRPQRQVATSTPTPPPPRNDTPDTIESLRSNSIPTMSSLSSASGSPLPPEPEDESEVSPSLADSEERFANTASVASHTFIPRSPVEMRSAGTSPMPTVPPPASPATQDGQTTEEPRPQSGQQRQIEQPTQDEEKVQSGHSTPIGEGILCGETIQSEDAIQDGQAVPSGQAIQSGEVIQIGQAALSGEAIQIGQAALSEEDIQIEPAALSEDAIQIGQAALSEEAIQIEQIALSEEAIQIGQAALGEEASQIGQAALSEEAIENGQAVLSGQGIQSEKSVESRLPSRATDSHAIESSRALSVAIEQSEPMVVTLSAAALPLTGVRRPSSSPPMSPPMHWDEQYLPVFTEDQRRQQEQERPQEPYSDAYLYGMPSRKRRCVRASRPPTTIDGLLTETVREVTEQVNSLDTTINSRLQGPVRTFIRARAENSDDYDPLRYSATARFLNQTITNEKEPGTTTDEKMEEKAEEKME